jgi:hypothetical protein
MRAIIIFYFAFTFLFCFHVEPTHGEVMKKKKKEKNENVPISQLELRLRLTDYYIRFTGEIEASADQIIHEAADPEIKRAALMWKIYGISAMNKAINMPDPVASFYNAWPLSKQMIDFFDSGLGKEKLGEYHKIALENCLKLEGLLDSIVLEVGGIENYQRAEPKVDKWVKDHPIKDLYFTRETTLKYFAEELGQQNFGLGKSVSTITELLIELSNKVNLYADILPRQARWQADLALMYYLGDSGMVLSRIDRLINSFESITAIVEMTPELLDHNRDAALSNIDLQRQKSLELLISERKAVISQLVLEREELVKIIMNERQTVIEEMKGERAVVMDEMRSISADVIQLSGQEMERIVDYIFWKVVVTLAVIAALIVIAIFLYKKI